MEVSYRFPVLIISPSSALYVLHRVWPSQQEQVKSKNYYVLHYIMFSVLSLCLFSSPVIQQKSRGWTILRQPVNVVLRGAVYSVEEAETQEMHYFSYINFISHYIPKVHSPLRFAHNGKLHSWKQRAGLVPQNAFPDLHTCGSKNGDRATSLFYR